MNDSGKSVTIDEFGRMRLFYDGRDAVKLKELSSGERQILVLIIHLVFNKASDSANIIIIDEPELSLHIAWQEMFCDKILEANGSLQAILATHSPSIISDRVEDCVAL